MANVAQDKNEEQAVDQGDLGSSQDIGSNDPVQTPAAQSAAGPSLSSASTMDSGSAPKPTQAAKGSSAGQRFSNLKKFVAKNQDSNVGAKIGSDLQKKATNVGSDINKANELFQQKSATESARVAEGEQIVGDENTFGAGAADFAADQSNLDKFSKLREGQKAQFGVENQRGIEKGLSGLQESAKNLGTESGRFQELGKTFGAGRNYTRGQGRLDQLLLQNNAAEQGRLADIQKNLGQEQKSQFSGLQENIGSIQQDIDTRTGQIQSNIQNKLFGNDQDAGLLKSVSSDYRQQLADANARGLNERQDTLSGLQQNQITQAQADQLGLTAADLSNTFGVDAGQFLTEANVNQNRVLNADEANRFNALRSMGNVQGSADADILGQLDASQAVNEQGAYGGQQSFIDAVQAAKGEYTGQRGTLDSALSGAEQSRNDAISRALLSSASSGSIDQMDGGFDERRFQDFIKYGNINTGSNITGGFDQKSLMSNKTLQDEIRGSGSQKLTNQQYNLANQQYNTINQKKSAIDDLIFKYSGGANSGLKIGE